MYEEIACIFSKLHMIRMHLFPIRIRRKAGSAYINLYDEHNGMYFIYYRWKSNILNRIIPYAQCVYCLISTGILAFINDDLITENNRAKILVIRYFQQRNNNKRNF